MFSNLIVNSLIEVKTSKMVTPEARIADEHPGNSRCSILTAQAANIVGAPLTLAYSLSGTEITLGNGGRIW